MPSRIRTRTIHAAIALTFTLILLVPAALAQNTNIHSKNDPKAVAAVEQLERELCVLLVRGDWDEYASHLAEDYVRVLPGRVQNKKEVIEEFRSSATKLTAKVPEKMQTRIYGDTAVVIIDLTTQIRGADGGIKESHGRATKVFVRQHGQWYLVQLTGNPQR